MPSGASVIRYAGKRGVVWRIKYVDAGGHQVMETLGPERDGWSRKKADAELRERLVKIERRGWQRPRPLTFAEYAETWLAEGERRRDWKPATPVRYRPVLRRLNEAFGATPLGAIRPREVSAYIAAMLDDYSAKTVNLDISVLHHVFRTAVAEELVETNPVSGIDRPKPKRRKWRILRPEEVARVAGAFRDDTARLIFLVLVLTGVRRFELQSMRWRDIDFITSTLRIPVSKSEEGERSIALTPTLADALWQHRRGSAYQGDGEYVFAHATRGSRLDAEWYATRFQTALAAAGIGDYVRPFHDARHASLTNGAVAGENSLELMARAGHRSMATTKQYLHLAGVTFPERAAALEQHLLGGRTFYPTDSTSSDATEPHPASEAAAVV